MKKIIAAFVLTGFAAMSYAQNPAPSAEGSKKPMAEKKMPKAAAKTTAKAPVAK